MDEYGRRAQGQWPCEGRARASVLRQPSHWADGRAVAHILWEDGCGSEGGIAFACLQNRVAYLGVTYNEVHSKLLEGLDLMQTSMADPSSPLFNNNYAQAIGVVTHTPTPKPGPKAKTETKKRKANASGKPKPKPKAKATEIDWRASA